MEDSIHKIWGERRRILLSKECEIDLLYLKKDTFCSTHRHEHKANKFYVVSGKIEIQTEFDKKILIKDEHFSVYPPVTHRFVALEDSIIIELAYVTKGKIDTEDIRRLTQGGKIIAGEEMTENSLREKGLLNL
jgi:quercetin dioxygenase-like cupin family protein